jgi:deoxyribodipyrimidine photo-lyase
LPFIEAKAIFVNSLLKSLIMKISICWLRRDLRLEDNCALFHSLSSGTPVMPVFIFDTNIIQGLEASDKRLIFIYKTIMKLKLVLESKGSTLHVYQGNPTAIFEELFTQFEVASVYASGDYEPYSLSRDLMIKQLCQHRGIVFNCFDDHIIFHPREILKPDSKPYHVFTPYSKNWISKYESSSGKSYPSEDLLSNLLKLPPFDFQYLGLSIYSTDGLSFPSSIIDAEVIKNYHLTRDFPFLNGTSLLGIHLRFGTISIRKLVKLASQTNRTFLNELIWREFYQMILFHYPEVVTRSFKQGYDKVQWLNNQDDFQAWCNGRTGYPIVDAGMRQLTESGYMHNRVRMVTASFLTKHLLIDWRWGEAFFAQHLLDFELASNNGGWQWASGSGCDAVPYFRVFSPKRQQEKFDPDESYIKTWLCDYTTPQDYIKPIIAHAFARERAIAFLKRAQKA